MTGPVLADGYVLKKITPEVQQALDGRRDRYDELEKLKSQGTVGEGKDGFVVNLNGNGNASELVATENKDRKVVYETILKQNKLPVSEYATIQKVFAETKRAKAKQGQKIQLDNGQWAVKA